MNDQSKHMENHLSRQLGEGARSHCRRACVAAGLALGIATPFIASIPSVAAAPQAQVQRSLQSVPSLKSVDDYDKEIQAFGSTADVAKSISEGKLEQNKKLTLMRRWLVREAGYEKLTEWANKNVDNAQFLEWFLKEPQMLELYVTGGKPGGLNGGGGASHVRSIEQLMDIARHHEQDLKVKTGDDALVHRKMMVAAALGMNDGTRLWTGENIKADSQTRYGMIRTLRDHADTYHFKKDIFDKLPVDQMRWIFENRLADQEIPWLANYSNWFVGHDDESRMIKGADGQMRKMTEQEKESERLNAYTFTEYSYFTGDYNDQAFYNADQLNKEATGIEDHGGEGGYARQFYKKGQKIKNGWAGKYRFDYKDNNFPNQKLTPSSAIDKKNSQLWMVFEKGGVCGAIAKTAENVSGVSGLPATVCGQPGHAVCLRYEPINVKMPDGTTKQKMGYTIQNDVYNWFTTKAPEVNHKLCGWEEVHQEIRKDGKLDESTKRYGGGPFVLLAQDALDDMDNYVKCFYLRVLADASADNNKMTAVDAAIKQQPINLDAVVAKINLMAKDKATAEQWVELAKKVGQDFKYYPQPMHSIMKLIEQKGGTDVLGAVEAQRIAALNEASKATENNVDQADACRIVANGLLDKGDSKVAFFSFDGENAGVLKLGQQFDSSSLQWEYSLDGGKTYKTVAGNEHQVKLSQQEIDSITAQNDIKVKLFGVQTVNTIDIVEGARPDGYCVNDPERCIYLKDGKSYESIEVGYDGTWHKLEKGKPLPTDKELTLRSAAQGTALPSAGDKTVKVPAFKSDWDPSDAQVVHASELAIHEAPAHYASSRAERAIDGYYCDGNEHWETASMQDPYIVIDLGRERSIKYLDIIARGYGAGGNLRKIKVSVAPADAQTVPPAKGEQGEPRVKPDAFKDMGDYAIEWQNEPLMRHRVSFSTPVVGRYIRIDALEAKGSTASAREFIFYEEKGSAPEVKPDEKPEEKPEVKPDDAPVFSDVVPASTPHSDHITWLATSGISTGWDNGDGSYSFRPYAEVARCDMAAFLYRMAGSPAFEPTAQQRAAFRDVDESTPHAREVWWLAAQGISSGWTEADGSATFHPYETVKRCDMAAFLYRLAGKPELSAAVSSSPFTDVDASTPHADAVLWLASNKVSQGWQESNGTWTFRPYVTVKRADMAAFLHRMDEKGLVDKA